MPPIETPKAALQGNSRQTDRRTSCAPTGRRWYSEELFGSQHEIEIAHGQTVYRLRLTSLGKLILTK